MNGSQRRRLRNLAVCCCVGFLHEPSTSPYGKLVKRVNSYLAFLFLFCRCVSPGCALLLALVPSCSPFFTRLTYWLAGRPSTWPVFPFASFLVLWLRSLSPYGLLGTQRTHRRDEMQTALIALMTADVFFISRCVSFRFIFLRVGCEGRAGSLLSSSMNAATARLFYG